MISEDDSSATLLIAPFNIIRVHNHHILFRMLSAITDQTPKAFRLAIGHRLCMQEIMT